MIVQVNNEPKLHNREEVNYSDFRREGISFPRQEIIFRTYLIVFKIQMARSFALSL